MRNAIVCAAVLFAACADAGDVDTGEAEVSPELDGKSDTATELSVRAGDTTLWVSKTVAIRTGENGPEVVLRGRTSRNLTDGRGFIFDDVYGDFAQKSARVFELTWPVSTARTLVDGVEQFIGLSFVPSSTRPEHLTARAIVRPRLTSFSGSTKIYLVAELQPVVVAGTTVYRIAGRTYGTNREIRFVVDDVDTGTVTRIDGERFTIDLAPQQVLSLIQSTTPVRVIADFATGGVEKQGTIGLSLKKLGMTSGDVETVWPPVSCAAATQSCLEALPDTALDLGRCGDAVQVHACARTVGVFVDDVAFQAKLQTATQQLATPALRTDAIGLAGADRADQLLGGFEQQVNYELERMFGRWYLGAAARDSQLDGAVAYAFDIAYARPLDYLEPAPVIPTDAAAMRQVAADAVLAELARMDFARSELARPLHALTREFRARHVASIRSFRETIAPEPYMTTKDVFVGDWLGLYTEVVVDRASGSVEQTLVEID